MCSSYIYKAGSIYKIKTCASIEDNMQVFDDCGSMPAWLSVAKQFCNFGQITAELLKIGEKMSDPSRWIKGNSELMKDPIEAAERQTDPRDRGRQR